MKIRTLLAALAVTLFALLPAHAEGPKWTGVYVGVHGGLDLTTTEVGVGGLVNIDGLSGNGTAFGGHVGGDIRIPGTDVIVGLNADYTQSNASFDVSSPLLPVKLLSAELDHSWAVTGRVGYSMGKALPYILGGYTQAKASASLLGTDIGSETLKGWIAGAGVEFRLDYGLSIAGEYRYTHFDSLSYLGGALELSPDRHEMRVALRYRISPF